MSKTPKKRVYTSSEKPCPICNSNKLKIFFETSGVPTHCNLLWTDRSSALKCPKGDIELAFCSVCGFITNLAFKPALMEYDLGYQNPLSFSVRFQKYAKSQAKRLIKLYDLYDKEILDIGCGNGYFLKLLCEMGNNRGLGFDPSNIEREIDESLKDRLTFIQDYYSERYSDFRGDLVVCRHTLEHIGNPKEFLNMLQQVFENCLETYFYYEVPNSLKIFQELFIWDIIYEHCSYFTPTSLSLIFTKCGFHISKLTERYDSQFLCIDARLANRSRLVSNIKKSSELNQISEGIRSFYGRYQNKIEKVTRKIDQIEREEKRVVIWGTGSKGVTFLNTIKTVNLIEYAVDINPKKQYKFVPGTGQKIVTPEFLREYKPDVIMIMNPIYTIEIRNLLNRLGLNTKFMYV